MFAALGRTVYRARRLVALVSVAVALLASLLAIDLTGSLSGGGWIDPDSESAAVARHLTTGPASGSAQVFAVYDGGPDADARGERFQAAVSASLAPLLDDPLVIRATGYSELPDDRFISLDGTAAVVIIDLAATTEEAIDDIDRLRGLLGPIAGVDVALTGMAPIVRDAAQTSEQDLVRAELLSLPLAIVILVTVFASLVAAAMPLLVAGLAVPSTLGVIAILAQRTEMSLFVLNVSTMLGLALAIDYSLFIVSRYREELARGHTVAEAVERAVATAGKAVVFSALAVAIGLSGLLLFEASALTSMGVAGVLVVIASATYAVTFLPAVLGMLGPRVNAMSVAGVYRRLGLRDPSPAASKGRSSRWWRAVARAVMARPVAVLVPTLALLLVLGLPFLQVRQAVPDATVYPESMESREAFMTLREDFAPGQTNPLIVLAQVEGEPTSEQTLRALADYARALEGVEGVVRVDSFFTGLPNPLTGEPLTTEQTIAAFGQPALRALLLPFLDQYVQGRTVRIDAISPYLTSAPETADLVAAVRKLEAAPGITTALGGAHAAGMDFLASMESRVPYVMATVMTGMLVALFLLFGSVVLPVKAVLMTLLSIVASFGALVWIFQQGNLGGLLAFEAPGYTIAGTPIVLFAVLFGLSMDYEVLLLSRIRESYARLGDNTEAVADGMARTAGVITGAAAIMVVVFLSFAQAEILTVKALGVGMAIAVFLDATVVRIFLVPATMRLLGDWNWWAPHSLQRLAERAGFSHVEVDEDPAAQARSGADQSRPR
ncbi:MAG: MMPL family transporter [Chloroflexota bacterium]|jgi:RND superfamily putative drug exporter